MKLNSGSVASFILFASLSPAHGQSYDAELKLGVDAYKNSYYEEAILHFRKAIDFDSSKPTAHMYLATSYLSQFIPGVDTEDNKQSGEQAVEQYQHVLDADAESVLKVNAAKGIAYVYLNMKRFDEAMEYYQKASAIDPKDPEPYYSMGTIDWTRCYQPRMEARSRLGLQPEQHLDAKIPAQAKVCNELAAKNSSAIEKGIKSLSKAIELRPDYDDAMAYMNLMYREKADLDCDNPAARKQDLKTADDWVDVTLATKKAKAERAAGRAQSPPTDRQ